MPLTMMTRLRWTLPLLTMTLTSSACDPTPMDTSFGGSGGRSTSSSTGSTGGGATSSSTSSTSSTSSSSTGGGVSCTPVDDLDAPAPTPGVCQGGAAVTCGSDGFLASETCGAGKLCSTYDIDEWRYDGIKEKWVPGRKIVWAGCLPTTVTPCAMTWNGFFYWPEELSHCNGAEKQSCDLPPAPETIDGLAQYGTLNGWLDVETCGAGTKCAGSSSVGVLTCIADDTPACDGSEPFCAQDGIVQCFGTWESQPGYRVAESCGAGLTCYDGITKPHCGAPGEVACDPASFVNTCSADGGSIVSCDDGFTLHVNCSPCMDENGVTGPCRCSTEVTVDGFSWDTNSVSCHEATQLTCVPIAQGACDPATDADVCNGNVAHRCVGHWDDVDCAASGLVCDVGQGRAGCREASAAACDTTEKQCEGNAIVACCICGSGWFEPALPEPPCVPGFEVRGDCLGLGPQYACAPSAPFGSAACVYQP